MKDSGVQIDGQSCLRKCSYGGRSEAAFACDYGIVIYSKQNYAMYSMPVIVAVHGGAGHHKPAQDKEIKRGLRLYVLEQMY